MNVVTLLHRLTGAPLPAHTRKVVFEVLATTEEGADVELPIFRYTLSEAELAALAAAAAAAPAGGAAAGAAPSQ